ncbi:preprotein translocase subunit SecG [Candidatus Pantoea edessiphila]|uniref:Protein-export membrane protein SecG n=1 Tax=Candidatus Pantoea edessiphila TaxID=2044610 RepID=A0A2P5T205_9GAMM|nr:preprotein translocase subunit SecG [Candidatus Pantoea edessiphila]PPI88608.1 preprotein translocase subunit SecG [Candidatus Pantoea edessiphila]
MYLFLLIIFFTVSIFFVALVMLQHSKGAGIETSFSSRSDMLFNSISSDSFLNRITAILAILFFITLLMLINWNSNTFLSRNSEWEKLSVPVKSQKIKTNDSSLKNNKVNITY